LDTVGIEPTTFHMRNENHTPASVRIDIMLNSSAKLT